MNRTAVKAGNRALRVIALSVALAATTPTSSNAVAGDSLGIVLSAAPSGAAASAITMRMAAEATEATVPIFLRQVTDKTLYGVEFSATPLVGDKGVTAVTPRFDPDKRTLPRGEALRRIDVTVSGLESLGSFTSTLYAKLANKTQTLGTLSVVHTLLSNELQIAPIDSANASQRFPSVATHVTLLVTVRNASDRPVSFAKPVISGLAFNGDTKSQADMPTVRVVDQDGGPGGGAFTVAAGDATTLRLVLGDLKRTGTYRGTLRVSAAGHTSVEQSFGFEVKQGPAFPAILIAFGVATSYLIRRRYSSGRIGRAGQRRLAARLLSDLHVARSNVRDLEPREAGIFETLERRLVDVSDELELARLSKKANVLSEIDLKIDLLLDLVAARRHVRAMTPESLQGQYESDLNDAVVFLTAVTPSPFLEVQFRGLSKTLADMPKAVEVTVRDRFQRDIDGFMAAVENSSAVSTALPLRVLKRASIGRELADAGRFAEARAELAAAQSSLARLLADDLRARMPDADSGPPGFVTGWQRFRAATIDDLRAVRRARQGEQAAEAYRRVWQDYVTELATRLKTAAARERRDSAAARKEQLATVVAACDDAVAKAIDFDPAAVDEYHRAVEGYLAPVGMRRSPARLRSMLEEARLPLPMTVVAAGLSDAERLPRISPGGAQSAASLTVQIRKRHFSLALVAGVAAIPAGLALLWAPNDTWGTFADGAAVFGWGFGLQALTAMLDARRLGWAVSRDASSAKQRAASETSAPIPPRRMRAEREVTG